MWSRDLFGDSWLVRRLWSWRWLIHLLSSPMSDVVCNRNFSDVLLCSNVMIIHIMHIIQQLILLPLGHLSHWTTRWIPINQFMICGVHCITRDYMAFCWYKTQTATRVSRKMYDLILLENIKDPSFKPYSMRPRKWQVRSKKDLSFSVSHTVEKKGLDEESEKFW